MLPRSPGPRKAGTSAASALGGSEAAPPEGVLANTPLAAASYAEVCLRTRLVELVHASDNGPDGLTRQSRWATPVRALVNDLLRAPVSLRRIRIEPVGHKGAPSPCGTLALRSRVSLFDEDDDLNVPVETVRRSFKVHGVDRVASRLRSRCSKAGFLVAVDGNAVRIARH